MSEHDIRLDKIIRNIREVIQPELSVPADSSKNPINHRITRIQELMKDTRKLSKELSSHFRKINTNLDGLLTELHNIESNNTEHQDD